MLYPRINITIFNIKKLATALQYKMFAQLLQITALLPGHCYNRKKQVIYIICLKCSWMNNGIHIMIFTKITHEIKTKCQYQITCVEFSSIPSEKSLFNLN